MRTAKWILPAFVLAVLLFTSCRGERDLTTFTDEGIGFSFEYPADYRPDALQAPTEVARFAMDNQFKLPVMVATVREKKDGYALSDTAELFLDALRTGIPGSSGFEIVDRRLMALEDGTDATYFRIGWKWVDGSTVMETVGVGAFKEEHLVIVSGTALAQQNASEVIGEQCLSLRMAP